MKVFVYRCHGDAVGMRISREPIPEGELEQQMEDGGSYCWFLDGVMDVLSIEGEHLQELLKPDGLIEITSDFNTFWNR